MDLKAFTWFLCAHAAFCAPATAGMLSMVDTSPIQFGRKGAAVELQLLDPWNQRTGFNPENGRFEELIPKSRYHAAVKSGKAVAGYARNIEVILPKDGLYRLNVIARKEGPYSVYVACRDDANRSNGEKKISGYLRKGQVARVAIRFESRVGARSFVRLESVAWAGGKR